MIRRATEGDVARIIAIAHAAFIKYVPRIGRDPPPMLADFSAEIAAGHVAMMEAAGAIEGPSTASIGDFVVLSRFNQNTLSGIQIIGRKPHASTGLHGWIAFKNKAIRERSDLPHQPSLQSI